ncbi:hypothetical protein DQ238_19530 [Geodermatophilus sp. TF02-6]|nr:hypothetical protein DQ238_19530 [Geodermatophilus sp. TF02-6]
MNALQRDGGHPDPQRRAAASRSGHGGEGPGGTRDEAACEAFVAARSDELLPPAPASVRVLDGAGRVVAEAPLTATAD